MPIQYGLRSDPKDSTLIFVSSLQMVPRKARHQRKSSYCSTCTWYVGIFSSLPQGLNMGPLAPEASVLTIPYLLFSISPLQSWDKPHNQLSYPGVIITKVMTDWPGEELKTFNFRCEWIHSHISLDSIAWDESAVLFVRSTHKLSFGERKYMYVC